MPEAEKVSQRVRSFWYHFFLILAGVYWHKSSTLVSEKVKKWRSPRRCKVCPQERSFYFSRQLLRKKVAKYGKADSPVDHQSWNRICFSCAMNYEGMNKSERKGKRRILEELCLAILLLWLDSGKSLVLADQIKGSYFLEQQKSFASLLKLEVHKPPQPRAVLTRSKTLQNSLCSLTELLMDTIYKELCDIYFYEGTTANVWEGIHWKIALFLRSVGLCSWRI